MSQRLMSLATAIILATLSYTKASAFNSQPKFILKAEKNKAFDNSSLVKTFNMNSGNIADCLEHCLADCRCQSFQICQNTKCQLCSSHKEENSSLLHDKDGCVYAMYQMQQSTKTFQKLDEQCSDMSCPTKYNCCQQPGLCSKNKTCKPFISPTKPWKRFTCECRDGYHGDNCDQAITSCQGYAKGFQKSGIYKLVSSDDTVYEVYCHFDSDSAWTLVQSYSYGNRSLNQFKKPLSKNLPVSENDPTWRGYRLSKLRMSSIKDNSTFLQFTCDYEKINPDTKPSDYLQIPLQNIKKSSGNVDVLEFSGDTSYIGIGRGHGNIGEYDLTDCKMWFHQGTNRPLHVHIVNQVGECEFNLSCAGYTNDYFGRFAFSYGCLKKEHRCVQNLDSTTQLWFGMRKPNTAEARLGEAENPGGSGDASGITGQ